jgi:glycosyltransferase involved in cell wall biosynthesis
LTSKDLPKVLVFSPTYEGKDYIFKEFWNAIQNLTYPNFEFIMIDNSRTEYYYKKLMKQGVPCARVPRGGNSRQALSNAQNYARKKGVEENFDYILSIESDIIPPPDTIQRLLAHDQRVVGALYYIGTDGYQLPCVFFIQELPDGSVKTRLIKAEEIPKFLNTGLRQVHGMGVGCTLVRRDVFIKYIFWYDERFDNKHSDVYFYMELQNARIPVYCDTNFLVQHYPSKWSEVKDK